MRHNPAAGAIVIMAHAASKCMALLRPVGELTEQGSPAFEAALPILSQLLKAEMTGREVRSTAHQLKAPASRTTTVERVTALEQEKLQGKAGQIAARLAHSDLVILDELGYLPFRASGGALLFHLLSKLYERTSVIITTNLTLANGRPSSATRR